MGGHEVPQPDVIARESLRARGQVPRERVRIAAEEADTTLSDDLGYKRDLYAAAGTAEYWTVDIRRRAVHRNWAPGAGARARAQVMPFGGTITSTAAPGLAINTAVLDVEYTEG